MSDWKVEYDAPVDQVWVCGACGRHGKNRVDIGDESCFLNAVLCHNRQPWVAVESQEQDVDATGTADDAIPTTTVDAVRRVLREQF